MTEEDCPEDLEVYAEGNTVFFFCDVSNETVRSLCRILKKVSMSNDVIKLCIRSDGGDVYAGFAAMDYIRTLTSKGITIETIAYGFCASAATFLLLAGSKRIMGENSYVLIHQMSTEIWGTYGDLRNEMRENKKLMKHFRRVYSSKTEIPEELLDKLMTRDVLLSANKCLRYHIVDELI